PEELIKAKDTAQAEYANEALKEKVENDPEFAKQFSDEQLEQIENGETPDGYTWHHSEEYGEMQLISTEDHQNNRHTGGKAIWGGGKENR
ncbi:HNH endonuclease, partial [Vibrio parahaemolyticus]